MSLELVMWPCQCGEANSRNWATCRKCGIHVSKGEDWSAHNKLSKPEPAKPTMPPIIPLSEAPAPRLQLRWEKTNDPEWNWLCHYELIIPLTEHDARRESKGEKVRTYQSVNISTTKVGTTRDTQIRDWGSGAEIETPFRDGVHASWDSDVLKLPVYAVFEDKAQRNGKIEEAETFPDISEAATL